MPPGSPPAALLQRENHADGPSEELSLGETGLIGLPAVALVLTFQPPAQSWEAWSAEIFAPLLAPALLECARLADQERARDLRGVDLDLASRLASPWLDLTGARAEGARLLAHLHGARSSRWLARFESWAARGGTPALLPTVFAARAALFHLPPRPMLFGYALLEWRAARGIHPRPGTPAEALATVRGTVAHLLRPTLAAA